jgi:YfiH family protein
MGYRWWTLSNGWYLLGYDRWLQRGEIIHGLVTRRLQPSLPRWVWPETPDFQDKRSETFRRRLTLLMDLLDISDWGVAYTSQVHGTTVLWNPAPVHSGEDLPEADGLITDRTAFLLGVTVADCIPIWIYDGALSAVGIVHAGWRGTVQGVLEAALAVLEAQGSDLSRVEIVLGPAIQRCCYTVGPDVLEAVDRAYPDWAPYVIEQRASGWFLDLVGLNILQARRRGLRRSQIHPLRLCTACNGAWLFSHRRGDTGRLLAFIGRRPGPWG